MIKEGTSLLKGSLFMGKRKKLLHLLLTLAHIHHQTVQYHLPPDTCRSAPR